MRRILGYLRPRVLRMTVGLFIKFVGTIMDLFLPWILALIVDTVAPTGNIPAILWWGFAMVVCSAIAAAGNIIANRMASRVARDAVQAIRHDLFAKISSLSCRQVDAFTIPSLESRMTTDTYNVHQMIGMMQRLGVRAPILLIGGILLTLTLDPILTLTMVCILPLLGILVWRVSVRGIPLFRKLQRSVDGMVRTVRENITGIRVTKALSKTAYEKERFAEANSTVVQSEKQAGITMALTNPMMNLLLNLGLTLVILVGAFRVNSGLSQPGVLIAFLSYFTIILNAMMSITRMFMLYTKGSASAGRISEVLDAPEELTAQPGDGAEEEAHVRFSDVCFSYHGREDNLHQISFSLKRGETLGVIGATGSGKSTLVKLLLRLYDPKCGNIVIGGRDVRTIPPEELYPMFGVVFQDDMLFADTIANNIDFGRGLSREQIRRAAEYAQAWSFIEALEDGLDHMLTAKGTNLSGGQRQRVLIARALAACPDVLILDDSSSALDYKTDAALRAAIAAHLPHVTTVVVAQRVSAILHADHILVLDHGRELGYGTHAELLETCPSYREISESQMGGGAVAQAG